MTVDEPTGLVLYVREGCHLCDQFLLELSLDLGPAIERLQVPGRGSRRRPCRAFGLRVPVLELDGRVLCEAAYDGAGVRLALGV